VPDENSLCGYLSRTVDKNIKYYNKKYNEQKREKNITQQRKFTCGG